jgi:undecaprenyl-diphosphatase
VTILQTLILAIVQGITEPFPISSAGHSVLAPYVFRWNLNPIFLKEKFLPLVVMMHLGTSIAFFIFFWKDWKGIIKSVFNSRDSKKLLFLIIVGTIPAAIIGFVFEAKFTILFGSALVASIFLMVNGVLLFVGESAASKGKKDIEDLSYREATLIGLFQSLALIPGFSRSGASITAGFWMGLKHEESARFSMLLATPIIAGASILEIPKLFKPTNRPLLQIGLIGGLAAGICALISVNILMKWFNKKEVKAMRPFSYYCWIVGGLILISHFI